MIRKFPTVNQIRDYTKSIWDKTPPFLKNKYVFSSIGLLIWILLFDSNKLIDRFQDVRRIDGMETEKLYYQNRIISERKELEKLKNQKATAEKVAREQYLMKAENEDIILFVKEENTKK